MGQEGYGAAMHATEELTDRDSITEEVTKYAEIATLVEELMAQMEANSEEKIAMMSMQKPPQPTYYQHPPPPPTLHI